VNAGNRKRVSKTVDTLEEAICIRTALLDQIKQRKAAGRNDLTFGAWVNTWLDRRASLGVRGITSERNRAKKHVQPARFASLPLDAVRRSDITSWTRELHAKEVDTEGCRVGWSRKKAALDKAEGKVPNRSSRRARTINKPKTLSGQTVRHCLKLVRGAFAAALDEELCASNPALGIKIPRESRTDEGSTTLTLHEQSLLLDVVPELDRPIVAVAIGAGLRMGEQWSLEIADVLLKADPPQIIVRYGADGHLATKAGRPRTVPLVGPALGAMKTWMLQLAKYAPSNPKALVFPTRRGCHRGKKSPRDWKTWLRAAGIRRRVRWHDLRHTCGSSLVSGTWGRKWSLEEVQAFLGHASIRTTEIYARFGKDALLQAARESHVIIGCTPTKEQNDK
jgi:integrase